jgi:hypothetical protein
MIHRFVFLWLMFGLFGVTSVQAQGRLQKEAHLALSASSNHFTWSPAYFWHWGLGKKQKFRLGAGLRYNGAWSKDQEFTTAPAKLTSGETGPQVLFTENIPANIDTFGVVGSSLVHSFNLAILLAWQWNSKWETGFNIDAIGFSTGSQVSMVQQSSGIVLPVVEKGKPYPFNALLVSDNDLGSLNSELYALYRFRPNHALRFGATFIFSEYQTDRKLRLDNDRFRHKSLQLMVGYGYRF